MPRLDQISVSEMLQVNPSHLRFARAVRLARALRGIRVMRLLRRETDLEPIRRETHDLKPRNCEQMFKQLLQRFPWCHFLRQVCQCPANTGVVHHELHAQPALDSGTWAWMTNVCNQSRLDKKHVECFKALLMTAVTQPFGAETKALLILLFYSFGVLFTQLMLDDCRLKDTQSQPSHLGTVLNSRRPRVVIFRRC